MRSVRTASTAMFSGVGRYGLTLAVAVCLSLGVGLMIASPALATPPTVLVRHVVFTETLDPLGVSCPGFDILENNTTTRTITDFYDADGNLIRETQHVSLVGTIVNSTDVWKTLPYYGYFNYTFTNDTIRVTGLQFETIIDGHHLAFANGYQFVDFTAGHFIYHGQNNYVFPDVICDPLS